MLEVWEQNKQQQLIKKSVDIRKFNRKKLMGAFNDFLC